MKEATDTFVAQLADGSDRLVVKGQPFPDRHELVLRDQDPRTGSGTLFRDADYRTDGDEPPPKSAPEAKAAAPRAAAPVKTAGEAP